MTDMLSFTAGSDEGFQKIEAMEDVTFTLTEISAAVDKDGKPYEPAGLFFFFRVDEYDEDEYEGDWVGYVHREKVGLPANGGAPGPKSNLYKLAQRLLGRDIQEGESINLRPLIGKQYKADVEYVDQLKPEAPGSKKFVPALNDDGTKKKKPTILNSVKPVKVKFRKPKPPVQEEEEFSWDEGF